MAEDSNKDSTKLAIDSLNAGIMDNKSLIHQSRANIEENRMMILSNYIAAGSGNQVLANHNTEEIFESRKTALDTFKAESVVQSSYIAGARNRSDLDFLMHSEHLNERCMQVNQKMVAVNSLLIEINHAVMELNQEILEFNEDNLDSNHELLSGALSPLLVEEDTVAKLESENLLSIEELGVLAEKNRKEILALFEQSAANKEIAIGDKREISQRRENIYVNRENIADMRQKMGKDVSYADIFLDDTDH